MAAVFTVKDRRDVPGAPFILARFFLTFRETAECKHLRRRLAEQAVSRQSVHHIAQHRIVEAVTDKTNAIAAKQFAYKPRGPAFGEIGQAEIAAGDNQAVQFALARFGA